MGDLAVFESTSDILGTSFQRVFFISNLPSTAVRGGHALIDCNQVIIALYGSFDINLFDGINHKSIRLAGYGEALFVPKGIWRELKHFTGDSLIAVVASNHYEENDYIRNLDSFIEVKLQKT